MKQLLFQTKDQYSGLILRCTLFLVIWPHGAQFLLGWFGGYGFNGTMQYLTQTMSLPWLVAFLVIMIQFLGAIALLAGLLTRLIALSMIGMFLGMIITSHLDYGFFMNWSGQQAGEGFEYHLLVIGMCLVLLLNGGGKYAWDQKWA
ncbi:MAG: DoxX family protein [Chitinophagaceae bacterium]|nr:DoxX family protein [Chitinophagaceae bacterium]